MSTHNIVIEECSKDEAQQKLDALLADKTIGPVTAAGMKAIVEALPGKRVSLAFNGSDAASGYNYASWNSHNEERDVPNEEERKLPNEPGYDRDPVTGAQIGEIHMEWAGRRDLAMLNRLGRKLRL